MVVAVFKRSAALIVAVALGASGWIGCAGWGASSETRMACCADGAMCPAEATSNSGSSPERVVTQAQADRCCGASDAGDSTPSLAIFSIPLSAALAAVPPSTMALVAVPPLSCDRWRVHVPLPLGRASKHVLLSVFLI